MAACRLAFGMAGNKAIELLTQDPKEAHSSFSADTVAVLQLFNNIAYRAKTSDDTIVRCRKDKSGHYRVDGCLLLPPLPRKCSVRT